jgi:phosphoglycolate phosphatase-like HAD superfamily hydrolase
LQFNLANGTDGVQFAGRTDRSLVREILTRRGVEPGPENFRRFIDCYVFLLEQLLKSSDGAVIPGVGPFLEALESLPSPPTLGLLTGNIRLGAEIKLRHFGLWHRFVMGAFGDDHEDRNQLAVVALERGRGFLGQSLDGSEVLVVGDTPYDIRCGQAIGARVLAVATGGATLEDLKSCQPDWAVEDLTRVSAEQVCR